MKTLLVYPEFPDTYWSFRHALSFEGKRSAFPPLGLLTISAMLPDAWERRLVDMNIQRLIVLALGVRGEFWRYLRRALSRHREKFAEAMRLAAVGYHFRKLTED